MNREILYRAKRKDNGEWVQGFYFCMTHDDGYNLHFIIPIGDLSTYALKIGNIFDNQELMKEET